MKFGKAAMRVLSLAALLALAASKDTAVAPTFGSQYTVHGTFELPYINMVEPITITYKAGVGSKMELYGGLSTTIQNLELKQDFMIGVVNGTAKQCSAVPESGPTFAGATRYGLHEVGAEVLTSAFPDLSQNYTYVGRNYCPGSDNRPSPSYQTCDHWRKISTILGKTGTYDFWATTEDKTPYLFEFVGHDDLFGSHYDKYVFRYESFNRYVDPYAFTPPAGCRKEHATLDSTHIKLQTAIPRLFMPSSEHEFHDFVNDHGKEYETREDYEERIQNYHKHSAMINDHNEQFENGDKTYTMAMNFMGDWHEHEFSVRRGVIHPKDPKYQPEFEYKTGDHARELEHLQRYTQLPHYQSRKHGGLLRSAYTNVTDAPDSWDWREHGAVLEVKDQAVCGSCWTFGSTGALEGAMAIERGVRIPLSQQYLVDCAWSDNSQGCGGGTAESAYTWLSNNGGIATAESYGPYKGVNDYCKDPVELNKIAKVSGYNTVTIGDEAALKEALFTLGPHYVAVDASHESFGFYHSGVYYEPACMSDPDDLDHAILAVGYGTDSVTGQEYWIVKNSWSTYWGVDGYIHMARNRGNNCGIASDAVHPILASEP